VKGDLQKLHEQLVAEKVFEITDGRSHKGFSNHKQLMTSIDWNDMKEWAKKQILNHDTY